MLDYARVPGGGGDTMTVISIDAADLIRKITTLQQLRHVKAAMKTAGLYLKGKASVYPASRSGPAIPSADKWGAKQRRGFFAKLRSGEIEVPYRRGSSAGSERLGAKWTVSTSNGGMTVTVGNDTSYGKLVQDPEDQTAYHAKTKWKTTTQIMEKENDAVVKFVLDAIKRSIAE